MTAPRRSFLTIRAIDPYGNGNLTAERYSTAVPDVSFFSARRLPACAFFKNCIHVFYPTRQSPDPRLRPCRLHGRHLCRARQPQPAAGDWHGPGRPADDDDRGGQLACRRERRAGPRADAAFSGARRALQDPGGVRPHPQRRFLQAPLHADRRFRHLYLRQPDHRHRRLGQVPGPAFRRGLHGPRCLRLRHLRRFLLP